MKIAKKKLEKLILEETNKIIKEQNYTEKTFCDRFKKAKGVNSFKNVLVTSIVDDHLETIYNAKGCKWFYNNVYLTQIEKARASRGRDSLETAEASLAIANMAEEILKKQSDQPRIKIKESNKDNLTKIIEQEVERLLAEQAAGPMSGTLPVDNFASSNRTGKYVPGMQGSFDVIHGLILSIEEKVDNILSKLNLDQASKSNPQMSLSGGELQEIKKIIEQEVKSLLPK